MTMIRECPNCGIEVTDQTPHCPRCNAVINRREAYDSDDPAFPTLDENSGRVEPETLPPAPKTSAQELGDTDGPLA